MKLKNKLFIIFIMTLLIFFLRIINVLQYENELANPFVMASMIAFFSFITISIQENIDHNYQQQKVYYQNLNILKYILSILVIVLHLRPFLYYSNELDLAFNNIVSRICVATVYKGNIIKNLIMDCQSYTKYRPNETTGGIFVSWRRKEELPTGA